MTTTPLRPLPSSVWRYTGPVAIARGQMQQVVVNLPHEVIAIPYGDSCFSFRGTAGQFFAQFGYVGQAAHNGELVQP